MRLGYRTFVQYGEATDDCTAICRPLDDRRPARVLSRWPLVVRDQTCLDDYPGQKQGSHLGKRVAYRLEYSPRDRLVRSPDVAPLQGSITEEEATETPHPSRSIAAVTLTGWISLPNWTLVLVSFPEDQFPG